MLAPHGKEALLDLETYALLKSFLPRVTRSSDLLLLISFISNSLY
jgi:hypothetical protein